MTIVEIATARLDLANGRLVRKAPAARETNHGEME
jgi:hypothetical protein